MALRIACSSISHFKNCLHVNMFIFMVSKGTNAIAIQCYAYQPVPRLDHQHVHATSQASSNMELSLKISVNMFGQHTLQSIRRQTIRNFESRRQSKENCVPFI
jgi:hypothetical protein